MTRDGRMEETWRAFAKLNLELRVLGRRPDGYHEIHTVLETIDLCDEIRVAEADSFRFTSNESPLDGSNLVVRAVRAFEAETGIEARLRIDLKKSIPSGAGLGGGSADAAVTLLGLNRRYRAKIPGERLGALLAGLGSDVPFFAIGGRAVAAGRGECVFPLPARTEGWILLVVPRIRVSTAEAYSWLTEVHESNTILGFCAWFVPGLRDIERNRAAQRNDFERPLFRRFPELAEIKRKLLDAGACVSALTGSGAAVFGVFPAEERANLARTGLDGGLDFRLVRALSRSEYRERMFSS